METENKAQAALQQALDDLKHLVSCVPLKSTGGYHVKVQADIEAQEQVRQALTLAHAGARRIEAAKAVQGDYDSPLTGILDQILQIATPLVALFGDFELSNLLGSLKVWLDRKRYEEEAKQLRREQRMSQTVDDLTFTYQF